MSCGHCEASVRSEVAKLAGVEQIDVSAATGRLVVALGARRSTTPTSSPPSTRPGYEAVRV